MNAKKALLLLLALVLIFAAVSGMFANDTVEGRARNRITTGAVDISIREDTTAANGTLRADGSGIDFTGIMPGQRTEKVVTIHNEAEKCWLRVKVDISVTPSPGSGTDVTQLIVPNIDDAHWQYENGYYYYDTPLEAGAVAELFDAVLFAPNIGNDYAGGTASMTITAEATQYRNNETRLPESWPAGTGGGV